MTINQLKMINIAPRGISATCVPTSICFVTGACYQDVEAVLVREQPKTYRPDHATNGGVFTEALFGQERRLFGHRFTPVPDINFLTVDWFSRRYSIGTYLVCIKKHMFVVKDGEIYDINNPKPFFPVVRAYKVEKIS